MSEPRIVDAQGLSCPQPVLLTRKAMKEGDTEFHVIVDTQTSRDNCTRIAEKKGWSVSVTDRDDGGYKLVVTKS